MTKKYVGNLKIVEGRNENDETTVTISGFSFHSALGISRILSKTQGDAVVISIYADTKNKNGNFTHTETIQDHIRKILLFDDEIWSRDADQGNF